MSRKLILYHHLREQHLFGGCRPNCMFCKLERGETPESLVVVRALLTHTGEETTDPREAARGVKREVGKSDVVILEHDLSLEGDTRRNQTFAFIADTMTRLERRLDALEPGASEYADTKWNLKAARRRLRRLYAEHTLGCVPGVIELEDADHRRVIRAAFDSTPLELHEADGDGMDVVGWMSQWFDFEDVLRLTWDRPTVVKGTIASRLSEVLGEAMIAYSFSLFRLAVAGCRAVVEESVNTAADVLMLPIEDDLDEKIDALSPMLPERTTNELHQVRREGNAALHEATESFDESRARESLKRTQHALEAISDAGLICG